MELEDMRGAWLQQQDMVKENLSLTRELLTRMKSREANAAIRSIAWWEYVNLIICFAVLVWSTAWMPQFGVALQLCYYFTMLYMLYATIAGIYRIRKLNSARVMTESVTEALHTLERLHVHIRRFLLTDIALFPLCIIAIYALVTYIVLQEDMFAHMERHGWRLVVAIVAGVIAAWWVYKNLYVKNIRSAISNLREIRQAMEEA